MKKSKLLLTLLICTMMLSACSSQKSAEQSSDTQSISETQSSAESRNDQSVIDLNSDNTSQKSIEESKESSKQTSVKPSEVSQESSKQTSTKPSEVSKEASDQPSEISNYVPEISEPDIENSSDVQKSGISSEKYIGRAVIKCDYELELPMGYSYAVLKENGSEIQLPYDDKTKAAQEQYTNIMRYPYRYDVLQYQYNQFLGYAKENMRKITKEEILELMQKFSIDDTWMRRVASDNYVWRSYNGGGGIVEDKTRANKIYTGIQSIQFFPDAYDLMNHRYFFWPDSDELDQRKEELVLWHSDMILEKNVYDSSGNILSSEVLYSYPYELEKAAIEKYGCSEERASRRLPDPYTIKYYTDPTPPETTEKLTGEEVLIPEDKRNETKSGHDEYERLSKNAEELGYGYAGFKYQQNVALGNAYPNMRKITVNEILDIANNSDIDTSVYSDCNDPELCKRWTLSIIPEIQKIQYFPDAENTQFCDYCYWPDADTVEERRTEIRIFGDSGTIHVFTYDDNGRRINNEQIFSLDEKVMSMLET